MNKKNRLWLASYEIILGLFAFVSFVYFFPRWADPNQNSRLDMVVAIVDDGTFAIDRYVSNTVDYAHYDDHYYSDKPPGSAFLGVPVYAVLKQLYATPILDGIVHKLENNSAFQSTLNAEGSGVYTDKVRFAIAQVVVSFFIAVIPSVILCLLIFRLCLAFQISPFVATMTALAYSLLTPAFPYSNAIYGHQLSSALLVGAFYLTFITDDYSAKRLLLISALLSYAVITEYPTALVAGALVIYLFYRMIQLKVVWPKFLWVALVGMAGIGVIMLYNNAVFGGPLNLGYEYSENWTQQHSTGFMSLTLPHWDAIWGITFGVFRGLFVLSPILTLALPGFFFWWKRKTNRSELWLAAAIVLLMFLFNSSSAMWWGGFSVGPRYLLSAVPFLALSLGFCLQSLMGIGWFRLVLAVITGWSFAATWGMSLAGQSFPPDTIQNPFTGYLFPNWLSGNLARNFATVLGLPGVTSLIPLILILIGLLIAELRVYKNTQFLITQKND